MSNQNDNTNSEDDDEWTYKGITQMLLSTKSSVLLKHWSGLKSTVLAGRPFHAFTTCLPKPSICINYTLFL